MERSNYWSDCFKGETNEFLKEKPLERTSSIFPCYNVPRSYCQFFLPMQRYAAGNLQSPWMRGERRGLPVTSLCLHSFPSPPWVRKCQSKRLNSLDRRPTVVLLLSTMATTNLFVDQGHASQLATIFFSSCSTAFDTCKTALIYSNANFLAEQSQIQLFLAVP